jgi:hypothetical protein
MLAEGVPAPCGNPRKRAGFHCMHRAPQHEIPSVGEITKNLAKRVAVGFHRINFGKVLVNPQPHHRKPWEADADLFKEKGTKTSHRARWGMNSAFHTPVAPRLERFNENASTVFGHCPAMSDKCYRFF